MQVTFKIGNDAVIDGFHVEHVETGMSFGSSACITPLVIGGFKDTFPKNTQFRYENIDGSRNVTNLIRKLLGEDMVRRKDGLQRLSAMAVLGNPAHYPQTVLSDPEQVTWPASSVLVNVAKDLSNTGIMAKRSR